MNRLCMGNPQLPGEREQVTVAILPDALSPLYMDEEYPLRAAVKVCYWLQNPR
jgi:hypothetical protein